MFKTLKNYIDRSFKNPLLVSGLVMVVGTNLYSAGQFLYHSIALRALGEAYYGDLAAIISILGIVGILQLSINLTIIKFVARHTDKEELKNFNSWINWWSILTGIILAVIFLIFSPFMASFLKLHQPISIYFLPPIIFIFTVVGSQRAVLQGLLRFGQVVASMMSEMVLKIILTIVFVYATWAIVGAMAAFLVGMAASFFLTRFFIKDVLARKRGVRPSVGPLLKFTLPVFIQGAALTSMYSTDILLVKHFFSPQEAGVYASVAVLGRIAFFISAPVAAVMFPLVNRRHTESQPYKNIFFLSGLTTLALSLSAVGIFRFFPRLVLVVFSGHALGESVGLLWWFAAFMGFLSLASLFIQFYLSVGKTKVVWLFAATALIQAFLIWFIHPDLLRVIQVSLSCTALLTVSLFIYFPYHDKQK